MFYDKKQTKKRQELKKCKYNQGKTNKAHGCGGLFEEEFKCGKFGRCILQKACKKPEEVRICDKCNIYEVE